MRRDLVFVDSSALLALLNERDELHERAVKIEVGLKRTGSLLVTSDWVLTELLNGVSRVGGREPGIGMVKALRTSKKTTVLAATRSDWDEAFELFASLGDKEWSLVDCASVVACRRLAIRRVFTHDRHFRQAGFQILL